jgi:hypothetical protein
VASLTVLLSGFADYIGVALGYGRLDLNMTEIPAGFSVQTTEYTLLRDLVPLEIIDRQRLWLHTLQHSFIPKLIIYLLIAYICVQIARWGREAIFEQKAARSSFIQAASATISCRTRAGVTMPKATTT